MQIKIQKDLGFAHTNRLFPGSLSHARLENQSDKPKGQRTVTRCGASSDRCLQIHLTGAG